ncbi:ABC transporter ATP-binding protein [Paenibacillus sp. PL2-23]|uniref:ABC transporter ATP-binding protein n=1 Tax=Paenibacillus sp. PL2-23 TaxID=2100729 RepID=UPI0030FD18C3
MNVIELKGLTKTYGGARGIADLSFTVGQGEIFGFIGPNGAGKSTTIRTMLGLIYPTSGSASIFGKDCLQHGPEIRKEVGYLPSEVFYYDHMKVKDLLSYSASFYGKDCRKRMLELAERMELDLSKKIDDLSLGNKKKVGIVQGLLHEPKLIILDEPTSGLDPLMQQRFFDLLEEENRKGVTILFSSHILSEVQRLCDRVAIIKEGRLIALERVAELKGSTYKKIKLQSKPGAEPVPPAIPGVTEWKAAPNGEASFLYRGDINDILRWIADLELVNLWVEEPDLEEIFMHYYVSREGAGV